MPGLEDTYAYREEKRQQAQLEQIDQRRRQRAVAVAMSEIQSDPRWKVYADHIEALRQDYERQTRGYEQALLGHDFLEPKRYGQLKIEQAKANGAAEAFKQALEIIKTLIDRGETAQLEEENENST